MERDLKFFMFSRKLKSNITKIYFFKSFLATLAMFAPIGVLFWQENGLSLAQIMILQAIFSVTIVFLEVPSGYFADIFTRRKALIFSAAFLSLGTLIYSLSYTFIGFLLGEMTVALSFSLASGADSALIYDTLIDLKKERSFKKIWGHILYISFVFMAVVSLLGGFIGKFNFRWTLYAALPFTVLLIPIAISLKEPERHKLIFEKGYLWELLRTIRDNVFKNKKIYWIILYSGIVYGFYQTALWLYQPYFQLSGLDIVYFGVIFAAFQVIAALGSKYAHYYEQKLGLKYALISLIFLVAISYFLMAHFIFLFSFVFAFLQQVVRGLSQTIIPDVINRLTPSEIRATILSVEGMAKRIVYALIIPFVGWFADVYSLVQAFWMVGIVSAITSVLFAGIYLLNNGNKALTG